MCILVFIVRKVETMTKVIITDGGRSKAGFRGEANDCVTRAVAIITERHYREVYQELARYEQQVTGVRSARNGLARRLTKSILLIRGSLGLLPCRLVRARQFT